LPRGREIVDSRRCAEAGISIFSAATNGLVEISRHVVNPIESMEFI
jgi:hypothetical protein